MNVYARFVAASAICAVGLTAPVVSQGSKDEALEAACRKSEVTAPDSCPCTIVGARKAGLNDTELASLFKDDGHSQPVAQAKYGRFWQVKSQCIADATMARMGITPGNPLPGVPASMRPRMPGNNRAAPPAAPAPVQDARRTPPAPAAARSAAAASRGASAVPGNSSKPDMATARANVARLMGNAYEYTEEDGKQHRFDFLAEDSLVIYQTYDPSLKPKFRRFVEVGHMSVEDTQYGPHYVLRLVDSGNFSRHSILSVAGDHFLYNMPFVRTSEEWKFRKVGPAKREFPEEGPQPLDDGFWKPPFRYALDKTNPFFDRNFRLAGWTNAANREAYQEEFAGGQGLIQIKYTESEACNHNCILVLNDFDNRARQVRGRVIEQVGVDHIGVRAEEMPYSFGGKTPPSPASLRAYDGYGGYTEWRCTRDGRITCREVATKDAPQARPAVAASSSSDLVSRLRAVEGELFSDAGCSADLYFLPANGKMPDTVKDAFGHIRTHDQSLFATGVMSGVMHPDGWERAGWKVNFDGRLIVLKPAGTDPSATLYSADGLTFNVLDTGERLSDPNEPSFGFSKKRIELSANGETEVFEAMEFGGC